MKKIMWLFLLICLLPLKPLFAQDRAKWMKEGVTLTISDADSEPTGIREVTASPRQLISLQTKLRYTTLVLLPESDEILDVTTGDKEFWVISVNQNIAHIKPAKAGAETNLNLVMASGIVYSFLLHENSKGTPDMRVTVLADPERAAPKRKYYNAEQYDAVRAEVAAAHAAMDAEKAQADERIEAFKKAYPTQLRFDYAPVPNIKPFYVKAIFTDGRFTFIQTDAHELPSVYEMKDDMPSLLNFSVENGMYVIPKVVDSGYLMIGKERLGFKHVRGAN